MRPFSFGRPPGSCYCMLVLESISVISDCPFGDQGLTAKCCRTWGCNPSVHRYTQFWFSWCPGTLESLSVCSGAKRSQTGRSMLIEHVCECTYKHTGGDTNARMNARWWGIHACLAWCWGGCTGWMYVYSVSLFIDTNDERWSWYSSILHFIVTNMITINQNRNHPPEPRTLKLMVGSWNVGVAAYFQGPAWLLGEAKMTRPGRRCTRTCPWAETGGSENLSWPVIQLDRKKMGSKKRPKTIKKDSSQDALPKINTESSSPSVSGAIYQPQGGATPCQTILPGWWFCPSSMEIDDDRKLHFHRHGLGNRWEAQILMILCTLPETRTVSLHLTIDGF